MVIRKLWKHLPRSPAWRAIWCLQPPGQAQVTVLSTGLLAHQPLNSSGYLVRAPAHLRALQTLSSLSQEPGERTQGWEGPRWHHDHSTASVSNVFGQFLVKLEWSVFFASLNCPFSLAAMWVLGLLKLFQASSSLSILNHSHSSHRSLPYPPHPPAHHRFHILSFQYQVYLRGPFPELLLFVLVLPTSTIQWFHFVHCLTVKIPIFTKYPCLWSSSVISCPSHLSLHFPVAFDTFGKCSNSHFRIFTYLDQTPQCLKACILQVWHEWGFLAYKTRLY